MLVIDLDGDGQVTQAKEIAFAEWTSEQDSDLRATNDPQYRRCA
jgi:hypothetical protein